MCGSIQAADKEMTKKEKIGLQKQRMQSIQEQFQSKNSDKKSKNQLPLDSYDISTDDTNCTTQNIYLPDTKKSVTLGIRESNCDTFHIHIPSYVNKLTLHINDADCTNVYLYAWHNPTIERDAKNMNCSYISNVMLPPRKYSYHAAFAATAAALLYYYFQK